MEPQTAGSGPSCEVGTALIVSSTQAMPSKHTLLSSFSSRESGKREAYLAYGTGVVTGNSTRLPVKKLQVTN